MKKPSNKIEFDSFMNGIDTLLKNKGIPIHARPIRAFQEIASLLKIQLLITNCGQPILNNYEGNSFSAHVLKWFDDRYGDKLKIDFSPAYVVVLIKKDPYRCRIPKIYGSCKFILDKKFTKRHNIVTGTKNSPPPPLYINVYELIEDLTLTTIDTLSIDDNEEIMKFFGESFNSIYQLEEIEELPFKKEAKSDLRVAVDSLLSNNPNFGLSKWSSLQFSEKIMKGFLKLNTCDFEFNHKLNELRNKLKDNNIADIAGEIVRRIQCKPDVRYDSTLVNIEEAIDSHHASLELLKCVVKNNFNHVKLNF